MSSKKYFFPENTFKKRKMCFFMTKQRHIFEEFEKNFSGAKKITKENGCSIGPTKRYKKFVETIFNFGALLSASLLNFEFVHVLNNFKNF